MARQRMAKLIKYGHSEAMSCHIMTYFMTSQKKTLSHSYVAFLAFRRDLAYTLTSATPKNGEENLSHSN